MGSGAYYKRPLRHHDGPLPTSRHIQQLLPRFLEDIGKKYTERPDLVVASWPEVIGPQLAPMTQALSFSEGILTVKVTNSPLYSLLNQHEKAKLVSNLRTKFPGTTIKTIFFRLG